MAEGAGPGTGFAVQVGDAKADFRALLRNRNFMKLFWGQLISGLGDWLTTFALMSLVFQNLTRNSSLAVGGLLAFRIVPALFSGPIAALVSDRFDRRRLMIGCDIARGFIVLTAPLLNSVWQVYVLLFFMEGLSIIRLAARDASIPNLVEEEQLTMANSLSMATTYGVIPFSALLFSLMMIPSGSYATGSYLASHPTSLAFVADSVTFFVSALFLMRMHLESPKHHEHFEQSWRLKESMTFAVHHPLARSLLLAAAVGCIGGGSLYAVGIGYVKEVLNAKSDASFGFLMALFGLGMISGVVALQVLGRHEDKSWMLRIALVVIGGIMMGMSFVRLLWLVYVLAVFFGAAFGVLLVVSVTIIQERIDDQDRGKAFAAFHSIARIFLVVGSGLAGAIAGFVKVRQIHFLGINTTIYGYSVALFISGVLIAAVSCVPLGEKKDSYREYFIRDKSRTTSSGPTEADNRS